MPGRKATLSTVVYAAVSLSVLYLGYALNFWRATDYRLYTDSHCTFMEEPWILGPEGRPDSLLTFDRRSEGLVVGRLVASRAQGLFSWGGFTGCFTDLPVSPGSVDDDLFASAYQYKLYLDPQPEHVPEGYETYRSQIGGQALLLGALDGVLPFGNGTKLRLYYHLMAFFTAVSFVAVFLWFFKEFGSCTGWFLTISFALLCYPTLYAKSLWWVLWAFYIPFLSMLWFYRTEEFGDRHLSSRRLFCVVFAAMLAKVFFNGCEYITTTIVMAMMPQCYYAIKNRWSPARWLNRSWISLAGCVLAIGIFFVALSFQYVLAGETFLDGVRHIGERFLVRTHGGGAKLVEELGTRDTLSLLELLRWYSTVPVVFDLRGLGIDRVIGMKSIAALYLGVTAAWVLTRRRWRRSEARAPVTALLVTLWLSALAPYSWFVIFKGHSDVHRVLAGIVWYMPFMFYGMALVGVSLEVLIQRCRTAGRASLA